MTEKADAYSYIRFSTKEQAKGDSIRRQKEDRDAWLAANKDRVELNESVSMEDKGISAFTGKHRENPDRHALAAFLRAVEQGRVKSGSYLIVESLDRLSREHVQPALRLILGLIEAGIRIVQLKPVEKEYHDKSDAMDIMMMIMELSRGNSESQMKSDRVGKAWQDLKRAAAEDKVPITKRVPAWLSVKGERIVADRAKAAVVKRIYRMAIDGYGIGAITKKLNQEGVLRLDRSETWGRSYVAKLLSNRAVFGEYQPYTRRGGKRRSPEGEPIQGYFPVVVSEEMWHAARAAMQSRKGKEGRPASLRVNIFSGLLRDARDGGRLHQVNKGKKSSGHTLVSYRASNGVKGAETVSFPLESFEQGILRFLKEVNPREVLPNENGTADKVQALENQLLEIDQRIDQVNAELVNGKTDVPLLASVLRQLGGKRAAAIEELNEAKRAAASPLSAAWGECQSLAEALQRAPDRGDARVRLRAALRRIVKEFWCIFVAMGRERVAVVQAVFRDTKERRSYIIRHRPGMGGNVPTRPAEWEAYSFREASEFDLSDPSDALAVMSMVPQALSP